MTFPLHPAPGAPVAAVHPSAATLKMLTERRSVTAALLAEPGPPPEALDALLAIAARVPDHRKVAPFRFIAFEGEARAAFGDVLVAAAAQREAERSLPEETVRGLFCRAPVVVAVISSVDPAHKTPEWEQVLTAGAVSYNLLLAASAAGFAGQWLTEWMAYDDHVRAALGLGADERVAGFVYLGTAQQDPMERARPDMVQKVSRWMQTP